MRRETGRRLSVDLAALGFLLLAVVYAGWRVYDPLPVSDRLNHAWFMLFYEPPTWRLEWGGDAQRIKPYDLGNHERIAFGDPQDWLTWEPRDKPWWEPDEPLWTLEASFQTCQRWLKGPRESVCD